MRYNKHKYISMKKAFEITMKTIIFNGSPRPSGDTAALIQALSAALPEAPQIIDAYRADIHPCVDCRQCWHEVGCVIQDEMQPLYRDIIACDCIIIASPVYFSSLTGPLLSLMSRLQMFYTAAHMQGIHLIERKKVGGILLCGGGNGRLDYAEKTAEGLLYAMHAAHIGSVCTHCTDTLSAKEDALLLDRARRLADALISAHRQTQ